MAKAVQLKPDYRFLFIVLYLFGDLERSRRSKVLLVLLLVLLENSGSSLMRYSKADFLLFFLITVLSSLPIFLCVCTFQDYNSMLRVSDIVPPGEQ